MAPNAPTTTLEHRLEPGPDGATLFLSGHLGRLQVKALSALLSESTRGGLTLDLSEVRSMDSAVVATLIQGWRAASLTGGRFTVGPMSEPARQALSLFRLNDVVEPPPRPPGFFEAIGAGLYGTRDGFKAFFDLSLTSFSAIGRVLLSPRSFRWHHLIDQCIYIGSQALPIVGLICFLIGLVLAFQSAHQLRQFGADIFVADLTAVAMVREMGPLMTAILVAGRSGSSIAAEIATMKVSEEVDALEVMGVEPIGYLAVPRLLAITLMMPLLTILADLLGILGGFLVGTLYLDIAWNAFLNQTIAVLTPWDVTTGIIKSGVFAFGIGLIGLHNGFRVSGGAGEVGRTTTSSVVASIFYVIVADAVFSILFYIVL
ncbi:MAG: MlaE family lipid ABC transporter permease subunit [Bradymonadia bacterium]